MGELYIYLLEIIGTVSIINIYHTCFSVYNLLTDIISPEFINVMKKNTKFI